MCIINTTFGFVFVHVPKSAGTSVTSVLSKLSTVLDIEIGGSVFGEAIAPAYVQRHRISKHSPARELRSLLGEQLWARYTSFAVVRHPLTRLASAYRFLRSWDSPQNELFTRVNAFGSFQVFVESDLWITEDGPDRVFRPQANWLTELDSDALVVDTLCKVESLDEDFFRLLKLLGVKASRLPSQLPTINATRPEALLALPGRLLDKVAERYAIDLRLFGYEMPAALETAP
jgi:hypothetical protein